MEKSTKNIKQRFGIIGNDPSKKINKIWWWICSLNKDNHVVVSFKTSNLTFLENNKSIIVWDCSHAIGVVDIDVKDSKTKASSTFLVSWQEIIKRNDNKRIVFFIIVNLLLLC